MLRNSLASFGERLEPPRRYLIAFSGGLDSTVLLHALATSRTAADPPMLAIHVDHGLHTESVHWRDHCEAFAKHHDFDFAALRVAVATESGRGPEAAARDARYSALRELVESGDWLLTAHHRDDLAETLLINLLRGSGPSGLAGIAAQRRFAGGYLIRPLLDTPKCSLREYARLHALEWVSDQSNMDTRFDRNYLRHEVLPMLERRWQDSAARIARSAEYAREATMLLEELAEIDRLATAESKDRLSIFALRSLSAPRQRNLLRYVMRDLGLPAASAAQLDQVLSSLIAARGDAQPVVAWPGARVRRYRDRLYFLTAQDGEPAATRPTSISGDRVPLGEGLGTLVFRHNAESGLSDALIRSGLELRYRTGGEEIKPAGQRHTRTLKKLLQEAGVLPWMRDRIPLLYVDGRLVAVADLWLADHAVSRPGVAVIWENRPDLH